jgi:gamma-glutamyltranspeptidase/glutathione hydrolase
MTVLSPPFPVPGRRAVAACDHPEAARVAVEILARGGNAVDAAVAMSLALGVLCPHYLGIGGGGFMLVWRPGMEEPELLDYRETAPAAAHADMFEGRERASLRGALSVAVPSALAGLAEVLARHGSMSWQELLEPAADLARRGFPVYANLHRITHLSRGQLRLHPGCGRLFLRGQEAWPLGETLTLPDLADTLGRLARLGPEEFYRGELARRLVAEVQRGGGILTASDLAAYRPVWRRPLRGEYRGHTLYTVPPPSGGGYQVVACLGLLESFDFSPQAAGSSAAAHLLAEAFRLTFAERSAFVADPAFAPVPLAEMLAPQRLEALRRMIHPRRAQDLPDLPPLPGLPAGPGGTSSYAVADRVGGWVVATESINLWFGSMVVPPGTGILLNNLMNDFSRRPGIPDAFGLVSSVHNRVEPGKRPASSSAPVLVFRQGRPVMAVGSAGGSRIPTSVVQILMGLIDYRWNAAQALAAPRVHHQWLPPELAVESAVPPDVRCNLEARGHQVVEGPCRSHAVALAWSEEDQLFWAAGDPRSGGGAAGL